MRAPGFGAESWGVGAYSFTAGVLDQLAGFAAALGAARATGLSAPHDTFLTAVSPGLVAAALENRHYPDDAAYVDAVAEALAAGIRGPRPVPRGPLAGADDQPVAPAPPAPC